MRGIKFRAWDKTEKAMASVVAMTFDGPKGNPSVDLNYCIYRGLDDTQAIAESVELSEVELMQYTGLKDRNGTEIYDGDIVRLTGNLEKRYKDENYNTVSEVIFNDDELFFDAPKMACALNKYTCADFEVIGNIFENPELLK